MWKKLLLGLVILIVILGMWGLIEPRITDVRSIDVEIDGLPAGWDGARIAFISDLQLGIFLDNSWSAERMVNAIVDMEPDLVLLGGDYVYSSDPDPPEQVAQTVELLRPLSDAELPTFAVLGNHDIREDVGDLLTRELEEVGIDVLSNEAVAVASPDGTDHQDLYLVGIAPHIPGLAHPVEAVEGVPDGFPRIVLMHNPDSFARLPAGTAPFAIAGHTHGGQIRVPFLPEWSWMSLVQGGEVTVDGFIDDYGEPGNLLYVSRGIGMSVLPLRILAPPELTMVTLESGD